MPLVHIHTLGAAFVHVDDFRTLVLRYCKIAKLNIAIAKTLHQTSVGLMEGTIIFTDNPWPEGHPIEEAYWDATENNGKIRFDIHIKTVDPEKMGKVCPNHQAIPDVAWTNEEEWRTRSYAIISSTYWGEQLGINLDSTVNGSNNSLDGQTIYVDKPPHENAEYDELAFGAYIMANHGVAAYHEISFEACKNPGRYNIDWKGRYAWDGLDEKFFKHDFHAILKNVEKPEGKQKLYS